MNLSASELIDLASLQPPPESDMNFSASWLDNLVPLHPLPEFADVQTVLVDDDAGITTPGILQVLKEENANRTETMNPESDLKFKQCSNHF